MEGSEWWEWFIEMNGKDVGWAAYGAMSVAAGVVGGLAVGMVLATLEILWYHSLKSLERRGLIKRLAPSIDPINTTYTKEGFLSVSIAPMPLAAIVFLARKRYLERVYVEWNLVEAWWVCWASMVLHDLCFWAVHTGLHKWKRVYKAVHMAHHSTGGAITVYNTAYGEFTDIAVCITPFYAMMMGVLYVLPRWNVAWILALVWAVNGVNMMGHCGYSLPPWVYVPGSLGVLLTPLAQRPRHHMVHHLDPLSNRSLYFTWLDRLHGTFRDSHPKILNP